MLIAQHHPELAAVWFIAGIILGMMLAFFIVYLSELRHNAATEGEITQITNGGCMGDIVGLQPGGSDTFKIGFNGALQAGSVPTWESGDASVSLAPAADGMSVVVSLAASETNPSFGLTNRAVASDGNPVVTTAGIPVLPATPPPPPPATQGTITQGA